MVLDCSEDGISKCFVTDLALYSDDTVTYASDDFCTTAVVGTGITAGDSNVCFTDDSRVTATDVSGCSNVKGSGTNAACSSDSSPTEVGFSATKVCGSDISTAIVGGSRATAGDSFSPNVIVGDFSITAGGLGSPSALTGCSSPITEGSESNFK